MMALTASSSHAMTPVKWPSPQPRITYSRKPPADGYRAPSFANEYPCSADTAPASRKEIQTAAPATSPAAPSNAKIPAPTMDPTPMNAAWRTDNDRLSWVVAGLAAESSALIVRPPHASHGTSPAVARTSGTTPRLQQTKLDRLPRSG